MKSEDENMELEKEGPFLAKLSRENSFKTPEGYFENLPEQVLSQIKLDKLAGNETHFKVPVDYFENLGHKIQSEVYLDSIKTENDGFNVPANYFSDSQKSIQNSVNIKPKTSKVIGLHFIRYAAAACILLTTSLGIYFNVKNETSLDSQLSKIPAKEIESYLNQHTDGNDLPMLIDNIDENLSIDDFNVDKTN
ncbi:MAG TPA: hypothetical protein VL125_03395 [Pelobium sp.]|nr:hypothetical protein [Pelobium sp.]